jgi:hypothetical protein
LRHDIDTIPDINKTLTVPGVTPRFEQKWRI